MKALDPAVRRETAYVAVFTLVLSVFMQGVFLILGFWNWKVPCGNLLGGGAAVLNFLLMGKTVQTSMELEPDLAKKRVRYSLTLRLFMEGAAAVVGVLLFDPFATVIPLFFPRIAVFLRPRFDKVMGTDTAAESRAIIGENEKQE